MLKGLRAGLTPRNALLSIVLLSNAFVWYYCADDILVKLAPAIEENSLASLQIWTASFVALIASAFIGAKVSGRIVNKSRFLAVWMMSGIVLPFASLVIAPADFLSITLLALGFGFSLGIGLPSCMEYFTKSNSVETRGRIGGIVMLSTGISVVVLTAFLASDLFMQAITLAAWRSLGLLFFVALKPNQIIKVEKKSPSYKMIIGYKPFMLYFVPWIMFSLVNYISTPVLADLVPKDMENILPTVQMGLIGVTALIGGFLADNVGRKPMVITGFISLGLGYAVLGLAPMTDFALVFHAIVNGVAWGLLLVVFVITVWGDLSRSASSEKFYALGVSPFFISRFLSIVLDKQITESLPNNWSAIFSFSAFFLFIAVLPLIFATETLPEKTRKDRELKIYIDKAQEIAQKYY